MQLADLTNLLDIAIPAEKEGVYNARLSAAIDQAKAYCNNDFQVLQSDGVTYAEEIPLGAQMGIALIVQAMGEKQNVASQSLGDMSKSFFANGTFNAAATYLKPYRKAKFV
jgi:hypothetical protein